MSNFFCDKCGAECIDSEKGYITGCEHYLIEYANFSNFIRNASDEEKEKIYLEVIDEATKQQND